MSDPSVLHQVATAVHHASPRPNPQQVVQALLDAETEAKRTRPHYACEALMGDWQLIFTAPRRSRRVGDRTIGRGWYFPSWLPAQISFHPAVDPTVSPLTIQNQIRLGGLQMRFVGPARPMDKKNLLAFDFTQLQISLGNRTVYDAPVRGSKQDTPFLERSIQTLPFFAFFWVNETAIAARGRGGGLALWVRRS